MAVDAYLPRPGDVSPVVALLEGDDLDKASEVAKQHGNSVITDLRSFKMQYLPQGTVAVIIAGDGDVAKAMAAEINGSLTT